MASVCPKTVSVFYLLLLMALNDLSAQADSESQNLVEKFKAGENSMEETAEVGKRRLGVHHQNSGGERPLESSDLDSGDVSDDNDEGDDDEGDKERGQFTAFTSQQHNHQRTRCSRQQRVVKFDTITPTVPHYNPNTGAYTALVDGLYIFSVKIRLHRDHQRREVDDVRIVTDKDQNICSISSQNGHTGKNSVGFDLFWSNLQENEDSLDELKLAKWDVEAELSRLRTNIEWNEPPKTAWEINLRTNEIEGFCEGVKHLHRGQKVFVTRRNLGGDGDGDVDDDEAVGSKDDSDVGLCDVISGTFSGSLLTRDI